MNQEYLSDEELKRLMEDVEATKMVQAPGYLKQQVLETLDADKARIRIKRQRKQLFVFEMKIAGGLAAAMLMLFLLPVAAQGEQTGETPEKEPTAIEVRTEEFFHVCRQVSNQVLEEIGKTGDWILHPWADDKSAESAE